MPRVFIRYNRTDCEWAEWIAGVLERAGYQPILQACHFRLDENFVVRMFAHARTVGRSPQALAGTRHGEDRIHHARGRLMDLELARREDNGCYHGCRMGQTYLVARPSELITGGQPDAMNV